ncbi:MAG TPA: transposase, partial [Thermosynechococcus sp. M46_R2017_013]|nr:transposase [Thermosynechococcus sp. M46_R2017_013]
MLKVVKVRLSPNQPQTKTKSSLWKTSITYNVCLNQVDNLPLEVRTGTCSNGGTSQDRNINAAINIREEGL